MEIAQTPLTNEERIATLEAIRAHIATVQDESAKADLLSGAMGSMATGVASQGFETATAWIAEAGLSATEIEQFVGGLSYQNLHHNEVGQWIEWALILRLFLQKVIGYPWRWRLP